MTSFEIVCQRLHNQHLVTTSFDTPEAIVQWQGAVQAQDYASAKWGIGLRLPDATDQEVELAFTSGSILRTHVLRPTWHFIAPADIRWMLTLTAPRVQRQNAYQYRKAELDKATFRLSRKTLEKELEGGKQLTRDELRGALRQAGIDTRELRLTHLLMQAELEGVICSGARRGNQFTYALLEERVLPVGSLGREEALSELVYRYFRSRGPATLQDFVWWSGLTMADAKRGMEVVVASFEKEIVDGQTFWFSPAIRTTKVAPAVAHLLPNYDEYFIGFRDRSAITISLQAISKDIQFNSLFGHIIVIAGQLVGGWKRTLKKKTVVIDLTPLIPLTKLEKQAINAAAEQYGKFLQLPIVVNWQEAGRYRGQR